MLYCVKGRFIFIVCISNPDSITSRINKIQNARLKVSIGICVIYKVLLLKTILVSLELSIENVLFIDRALYYFENFEVAYMIN